MRVEEETYNAERTRFWMYCKIFALLLFSFLVISCATSKFLGSKQPVISRTACPLTAEFCPFSSSKNNWQIDGTYYLDDLGSGTYRLYGSVKLDVKKVSAVYQSVSRLDLTFIFFDGDTVVLEEKVRLRGGINEYIRFSHEFTTDNLFESSAWAYWNAQITELPATPAGQKASAEKTYIRIEKKEQIFEGGQLKFEVAPGDILEVVRVRTCRTGYGICWQVRNIKTGEIGFRNAGLMKRRHTIFKGKNPPSDSQNESEKVGSISGSSQYEQPALSDDVTGTYTSNITGNIQALNLVGRNPEVKLIQKGKKVSGTYGNTRGTIWGEIWGEIEDGSIKFKYEISWGGFGSGEWTVEPDSGEIIGKWTSRAGSGKWNLTRIK